MKYVEYLQTSGTEYYWDTGLSSDVEKVCVTVETIDFGAGSGGYRFVGNYVSNSSNKYSIGYGLSATTLTVMIGNKSTNLSPVSLGKHKIEMCVKSDQNVGKCVVDDKNIFSPTGISQSNNEYYIGKGSNYYPVKIYDVEFVLSDNTVHKFVPCLDDSNVPCFYDEYNKSFVYGTGGGTLPTYGNIIEMNDLCVGSVKTNNLYVGNTKVKTAYIGDTLCYKKQDDIVYANSMSPSVTTGYTYYITDVFVGDDITYDIYGVISGSSNSNLRFAVGFKADGTYYENLIRWYGTTFYYYYSNGSSRSLTKSNWGYETGYTFNLTVGNNYVYDNLKKEYIVSGATTQNVAGNICINTNMMEFYSFKAYKNGTLISDCRPAYDKNNVLGIYDSVNKKFLSKVSNN